MKNRPVIDGKLDDDAWRGVALLTGFVQRELHEGEPVTERTEVRIVTDADAIYVGAWLYDRDPSAIVPGEKIRDVTLENSDYFALILDSYRDRQNGFVFATTPAGIEYDGQVVKEGEGGGVFQAGQTRASVGSMGGFNVNWDGNWEVRTSADSLGWYAEFRIPYSTLRYGSGSQQTWGLNLARSIRRRNEDAYWSFIPRRYSLYRLSRAGSLQLPQVPTQRMATMTPYALGSTQRRYSTGLGAQRDAQIGMDIKYGLTPGLTLDLTYNTDFAQVEVDEQRTNLTRFPLFFPEKRPFFLENAGTFSAGTPQAVDLFFTRRIGIDTLGRPVPILGGGRLSGRAAGLTVGALAIVTDEATGVQPANAYTVARVARELTNRSRVGILAVNRSALDTSSSANTTLAADGRLGLGDAATLDFWGARTQTPGRSGDDYAYSVRGEYRTADWNNSLRFIQAGAAFNPEVGFINRTGGFRFYELMVMRLVRSKNLTWLKEWNPHVSVREYFGPDGFYQSGWVHVDVTEVQLAGGGRFGPDVNVFHEGLQKPFVIAPGDTLPIGAYTYATWGLDWGTNASAPLSFLLRGDIGPFYNGDRRGGTVTFTYRRSAALSTSLLVDYTDVHLDQGSFERKLIGARVSYFFTPSVFVQTLTQYSNQAGAWSANARFGWLRSAGAGLFIVLNDSEEADSFFNWRRPQSRSLTVKYAQQFGYNSR
ncbi:MAG: DUF5916 domain-containing protein [Gemmatimonadota bacterium]